MKVGDLVKFRNDMMNSGPIGIVLYLRTADEPPHPSQPDRHVAFIKWVCEFTSNGHYQLSILEVVNENR